MKIFPEEKMRARQNMLNSSQEVLNHHLGAAHGRGRHEEGSSPKPGSQHMQKKKKKKENSRQESSQSHAAGARKVGGLEVLLSVLSATSASLMQQVLSACFREESTDVF